MPETFCMNNPQESNSIEFNRMFMNSSITFSPRVTYSMFICYAYRLTH